MNLDEFTRAYIEAMLWAENDQSDENTGGDPLDHNYDEGDISDESMTKIIADCKRFQEECKDELSKAEEMDATGEWSLPAGVDCTVLEYAGHDFWLTRQGHGCGFWDGDWPDEISEKLDSKAKEFGETYVYVGDDGKIYLGG